MRPGVERVLHLPVRSSAFERARSDRSLAAEDVENGPVAVPASVKQARQLRDVWSDARGDGGADGGGDFGGVAVEGVLDRGLG